MFKEKKSVCQQNQVLDLKKQDYKNYANDHPKCKVNATTVQSTEDIKKRFENI